MKRRDFLQAGTLSAIGLTLSVVLLYLILVAQFRSFIDPFIILLALPPGSEAAGWYFAARP